MELYSHIEERYCSRCQRNVGVEYTHHEDGSVQTCCLSKSCGKIQEDSDCFFNRRAQAG